MVISPKGLGSLSASRRWNQFQFPTVVFIHSLSVIECPETELEFHLKISGARGSAYKLVMLYWIARPCPAASHVKVQYVDSQTNQCPSKSVCDSDEVG